MMATLFPQSPTFSARNQNDRQELIRLRLDPKKYSIEEIEAELEKFFQNWDWKLHLGLIKYGPEHQQRVPQIRPVVVYETEADGFGGDPSTNQPLANQVWGPCITYGLLEDILEVMQIWKIKRLVWTKELRTGLKNNHLASVQEVLALGRWKNASNIVPNFKLDGAEKDVDWRFQVGTTQILHEVKFRRKDWQRGHPETENFRSEDLFDDIKNKFPDPKPNILHVAHIILIKSLDDEGDVVMAAAEFSKLLKIHAVIIESLHGQRIKVIGRESKRVEKEITDNRKFPRPDVLPILYKLPSVYRRLG